MKFFKFMVAAACLALLPSVYSCKDGNDEPDGPDTPDQPEVPTGTPLVTGINSTEFAYDSKGRLVSVYDDSDGELWSLTIDYDKGLIKYNDNGSEGEYHSTFNSNGTLKTLAEEYEEDGYINIYDYEFSYNKQGCLSSIVENRKSIEEYTGNTYEGVCVTTYKWKNGCLVSVHSDDGKDYSEDIDVTYSSIENKYLQYPSCLGYATITEVDVFDALTHTGILGLGPAYLPEKAVCEGDFTSDYTFTYVLNENGTIRREICAGDGYVDNYVYKYN